MNTTPETLDDLGTFATRSDEATRKGAQAFARLLQLAETRDSGQIPRIARFLAATYNGQAFQSCSDEHDWNNAKAGFMRSQAPRRRHVPLDTMKRLRGSRFA